LLDEGTVNGVMVGAANGWNGQRAAHQILARYFHTLRHMKARQAIYRGFYFLRNKTAASRQNLHLVPIDRIQERLSLDPPIPARQCLDERSFTYLNRSLRFNGPVDWNYSGFGKLWEYNLNYFDFLNQPEIGPEKGLGLIYEFMERIHSSRVGLESYPICLRTINWIKFLSRFGISDRKIDGSLRAQVRILRKNLEYHIMGNHLLENGFALLYGSFYFRDRELFRKARKLLTAEMAEQILSDGGHFELSPMYHQIILDRLLDCVNLVQSNPSLHHHLEGSAENEAAFLGLLKEKASLMLGWMRQMTFGNGRIPLLNDSAESVAPGSADLFEYAGRLGIEETNTHLSESGYRKMSDKGIEILMDVGRIGPDYIPGHAHADTFNFLLHLEGLPVIIDTGTSTYENGPMRSWQRSTRAHNTVEIDGEDQSEMWGSHRVARRARVRELREDRKTIEAMHDGYRRLPGKPCHRRKWSIRERSLEVCDTIEGNFREAAGRFHFHHEARIHLRQEDAGSGEVLLHNGITLAWRVLEGAARIVETVCHPEFNVTIPNSCLEVPFQGRRIRVELTW
jgi:hypothetical protein